MIERIDKIFIDSNFLLMVMSRFVSQLGDKLFIPAILWMALSMDGGSHTRIGIVTIAMAIPPFLSAFIGVYVDRAHKKNLMITSDFLRFILCIFLFIDVFLINNFWLLVILIFLIEFLGQFYNISSQSFIPSLVGKDHILRANSLFSMTESITSIIGYSTGGILIALFGITPLILFNGISFLLSGILILKLSVQSLEKAKEHQDKINVFVKFYMDFMGGLKESLSNKIILNLLVVAFILNAASASMSMLITIWTHDVLQFGPSGFGLLLTAMLVGSLFGGITINTKILKKQDSHVLVAVSIFMSGCSLAAIAFFENIAVTCSLLFASGFCTSITGVSFSTMFMKHAGKENLGKLFGLVQTVTRGGQPLGILIVTSALVSLSPHVVLLSIGSVIITGGLYLIYRFLLYPTPSRAEQSLQDR